MAATAAVTTAAASRHLYKVRLRFGSKHLVVENMERRQADVGDFLITESEEMAGHGAVWRDICDRILSRCREGHTSYSQDGYGLSRIFFLRRALRLVHSRLPPQNLIGQIREKSSFTPPA